MTTQTVRLAYAESGLDLEIDPAVTTVVEPLYSAPVPDEAAEVRRAIREPVAGVRLRERVHRGQTVAISVCDITRPQPRGIMVTEVLAEIDGIIDLADVVVVIATGTHRANTDAELRGMLGDEIVDSVRIVNHNARDRDTVTWQGVIGDGVPVWLNTEWVQADVRITTGFVEPHFFAGFSGGPKLVAPGLAALDTVLVLHDARRIGDPQARWGVIDGNPIQADVRAIAAATGVTFGLDVVLNRDKKVVRAFGGDLFPMHAAAVELARAAAMRPLDKPFDVVVTTNSGYPLDQNLYQSVKGMSAGFQVVRPGGLIVCAAECRDGFPDHGSYRSLLASAPTPQALLDEISAREHTVDDQWEVQIQARIQSQCRVVMHTGGISDADLAEAHLEQTHDIAATIGAALATAGAGATVCVLPEGPQTIPYLLEPVG